MVVHPLDIAAEQVVRWLQDEMETAESGLTVRATRAFATAPVSEAQRSAARLGEAEAADLDQITRIGELEVAPVPPDGGWVLRIRAEDPLGPRLPQDHAPTGRPEALTLAAFQRLFIAPGNAAIFVNVETETPEDWERFQVLLERIRTDRHPG